MSAANVGELAVKLADEAAISAIETCTIHTEISGVTWLDFGVGSPAGDQDWIDCEDYIEYLEARGLLHRHPRVPGLVWIAEATAR